MAENAKPLATFQENGKINGRGKQIDHNNSNSLSSQGNSAEYLTARIARDRPDILET